MSHTTASNARPAFFAKVDLLSFRARSGQFLSPTKAPMHLKTKPFGKAQRLQHNSDIAGMRLRGLALTVWVASAESAGEENGLEIVFHEVAGFRLLDESDLSSYWISPQFTRGFHVVEVESGGWSDEEQQRQGLANQRREWLVVTGNGCVSVLCATEPKLRELSLTFYGLPA